MTAPAVQLHLGLDRDLLAGRLSQVDMELLKTIREAAAPSGEARSLFDIAVRRAGVDYEHALYRLSILEALGYVEVVRSGPGVPLIIRPVVG